MNRTIYFKTASILEKLLVLHQYSTTRQKNYKYLRQAISNEKEHNRLSGT
jgi:hypothetical protein